MEGGNTGAIASRRAKTRKKEKDKLHTKMTKGKGRLSALRTE